ncbi:YIP1 family protein [Antarcticimicrobium sediminis]|uniref:YIP1 family protein n=1 Tax=Antarcticimicrobium sediminis TaxID=2546227 RepID=A0A4R5EL58_9RHOB|nr:YIP1 family protein [Antarcticimicrobium sediminis]TDE35278.1 YIP1 family protein [Antarcticimicrobium sediminis]
MAVIRDIVATYWGPGKVLRRLLGIGQREDRALAILMAGCAMVFVAQLPRLAREAHLTGQELNMLLGASLLAWVIIAPLLFYGIAALTHLFARALGGKGDWYGARLALFWALLASSPLLLFHGLVAGFLGEGPALDGVGLLCLVAFLWFWIAGLRQAERTAA